MFSTTLPERLRTVAFRLTLLYTLLFGVVSTAGVAILYFTIAAHMDDEINRALLIQSEELSYYIRTHDDATVADELSRETAAKGERSAFMRILDDSGATRISSDLSRWPQDALPKRVPGRGGGSRPALEDIPLADERIRARVLTAEVAPGRILQIGYSLESDERFLADFRETAFVIVGGMLLLGAGAGWFVSRKAMSGVEEVTRLAARIADGHFSERVPVQDHGAEIDRLGMTFNHMADRIETLIRAMREVNDNIAHDLRSPLTRIRGLAESALRSSAVCDDDIYGSVVEECDRLLGMINAMLDISEAEAGIDRLNLEAVALRDLLGRAIDIFQPLAEQKGVHLNLASSDDLSVRCDLRKVQRALANLIDNAIKYTPTTGAIVLESMSCEKDVIRIHVRDNGQGIPAQEISHIFERFYRGDTSRSEPGSGLGLSLARAVARAHGGDVTVVSAPGKGSTFTLSLPVDPQRT